MTYAYYGYPLDFLQKAKKNLEAVTKEDILRVAKKYLKSDQVQILTVGNPADFDEPLTVFGEVNEIDITIPTPVAEVPEATPESLTKGKILLEKMIEKMGGMEKMTGVKNLAAKMKLTQVTPMGEMEMDGTLNMVYPDKIHMSINTPMGEMSMVMVSDEAWMTSPQDTTPAPGAIKENLTGTLFRDPVLMCKMLNDLKTQYVGESTFDKKPVEELIISGEKLSYNLYLDKTLLLPVGVKYNTIGQQGPTEVTEYFKDYREVTGLKFPFNKIAFEKEKKVSETSFENIEVNAAIDMKIFDKK